MHTCTTLLHCHARRNIHNIPTCTHSSGFESLLVRVVNWLFLPCWQMEGAATLLFPAEALHYVSCKFVQLDDFFQIIVLSCVRFSPLCMLIAQLRHGCRSSAPFSFSMRLLSNPSVPQSTALFSPGTIPSGQSLLLSSIEFFFLSRQFRNPDVLHSTLLFHSHYQLSNCPHGAGPCTMCILVHFLIHTFNRYKAFCKTRHVPRHTHKAQTCQGICTVLFLYGRLAACASLLRNNSTIRPLSCAHKVPCAMSGT